MKYAWNITNVSDLRAKPDHGSERLSQLFFSEIVEIIKGQSPSFIKVRQSDGYEGWVYNANLRELQNKDADSFRSLPKSVVISKTVKTYDNKSSQRPPYHIFYGTLLAVKSKNNNMTKLQLPNGDLIFIKSDKLRPIKDKNRHEATGTGLIDEAKKFIGIPYLWGGVTPLGFDCSGLVQAVYKSYGISLPRDTKDQIKTGVLVERDCIRTGDLLFFNRHVGLAIGKTKIIHASRHSGGVRIESLVKDEENFREDLANTFVEARRII
ncbi:MAG: SH3 domain-containing C40 family peptidase [bacterium]